MRSRRSVARAGVRGDYLRASADTSLIDGRGLRVPARRREPRGLPVPGHLRAARRRAGAPRWSAGRWPPSSRTSRAVDLSYARSKNLTVFDVVTIASMVEREAQVARERTLVAAVIYNRLKAGPAARHRRHDPLRDRQLDQPLTQSELAIDSPYNTRTRAGPAAGPDRQPRARVAAGGGPPGPRRLPLLRGEAGHLRGARVLLHVRGVRARPAALQRGARRGGRQVADEMLKSGRPARPPRRAQPLAGDAQRRLPRARPRLALRGARRRAGAVRRRACEACPAQGFAGANVTIPHKLRGARGRRHRNRGRRGVVGAANTLVLRGRARSQADNTDVEGFLTALRERAPEAPGGHARARARRRRRRRGPSSTRS